MRIERELKLGGVVSMCKQVNGKDVPALPPFKNLILDAFINAIYDGNGSFFGSLVNSVTGVGCGTRVGAGTTPPQVSDSALEVPLLQSYTSSTGISVSNSVTYDEVTDEYVISRTCRSEYPPAVSNVNLTELAVYTNTSSTNVNTNPIVSRTLIKDGLGAPTTLTLAVGEILVVFYTLITRTPRTLLASVSIKGVPTDLEMKLHFTTSSQVGEFPFRYDHLLGAMGLHTLARTTDFTLPLPFTSPSTSGWISYVTSSTRTTPDNPAVGLKEEARVSLSAAVLDGIVGFAWAVFQGQFGRSTIIKFNPPFNKTNQDVIDIETITTFTRL